MKITKKKFCGWAAALHLGLVFAGATSMNLGFSKVLASALNFYGSWTGANSGYAFFAPGVGSQLRATFEVVDGNGQSRFDSLEQRPSSESELRVGNIIGSFWNGPADQKLRRTLAGSWAGKVFGRHPDAEKVVVQLESYYLPSMAEYRNGARPAWKHFYRAAFLKKST